MPMSVPQADSAVLAEPKTAPSRPRPFAVEGPTPGPGKRVAIVGGGMLGAALALRLRRQGHRVTLIEAAPRLGGLASSQAVGGVVWDRFYHVILLSDQHLRDL